MSESLSIVLTGRAYQRRATLEIRGDTLMWRAQKGQLYSAPENIATSVHDVKNVMWLERRGTIAGAAASALGLGWFAYGYYLWGALSFGLALAWIVWRATHPTRFLGLELGGRWLVLTVDPSSAVDARALAARIEHTLLTGATPDHPPALP